MQENFHILTILAIVVAVFVILRLRSVLGRRTDEDEARISRQIRAREQHAAAAAEKVVTLPQRNTHNNAQSKHKPQPEEDLLEKWKSLNITDKTIRDGLLAIAKRDSAFDIEHFVVGAKQAYEMIVTAFAEGNRNLLRDLLSEPVFEGFDAAISEREQRKEQVDQSFVGINKAEVVDAELHNNEASITVKFISQLISATRDESGEVISGDPLRVMEVTDIWTFSRDVTSQNPNWRLIATKSSS
ncbi:MAG: Tim44/TimA family putative adaptor protein [Pseudomonadota bacterium]